MSYLYPGIETCRALIVDSNHVSRSILSGQLRDLGVGTVVQSSRPQDARVQLELQPFDFVMCDYHFDHTDYSGQDLLDDLRRCQLLPYSTTFVMVTGEASYNKVAEAAESALDSYLVKPYSANTLSERLLLSRRRKNELRRIFTAIENGDLSTAAHLCVDRLMNEQSYALYAARIGGELLLKQGLKEEATALYQKVLEKNPSISWALLGLARTHVDGQRIPQARRMLESLIRDQPGCAEAYDMLGSLLVEQGELANARDAFQRAWEITPSSITRSARLGAITFYIGDKEEAARPLERASALGIGSKMFDHQSLLLLAFLRHDDRDSKGVRRALSALESALDKSPDNPRLIRMVRFAKIVSMLVDNKHEAAFSGVIQLAEHIESNDPDVECAFNMLALLARLPTEHARGERSMAWIEQLTWRFSGSKAAAQLLLSASENLAEQQAQVQENLSTAQSAVQAALTHALTGKRRHTVTELMSLASRWRNAKWAEMASHALDRHRSHIPDADELAPAIKELRQSLTAQHSKLPLGLDTVRQAGGLSARLNAQSAATQST